MNSHYDHSKSFQTNQSDSVITPQEIYQTLIRQTPNLYPLCKFKTKCTTKQLFPDAVKFPDFFNYNLVSPGRVIKKLQGPQSIVKGFYYQLMKLAFQIEIQDRDYIEVMKNVIFSPEFMLEENPSSPSSGKNYSDLQYKKIVAEFMQILMHQSIPNFQLTILSYPIVDQAMVKILENLLKFKSSLQIPINASIQSHQVLQHLCELFQVTVQQYGNCYKFQESDIFLYEHSRNEFYIAFLNEMAEMSDISESSKRKDSSYEPNSSKKLIQCEEQEDEFEQQSGKKARRTHEYLNSQFEIQTPTKQHQPQQRNCLSNLTESKTKSQSKITEKNYRNTFGFHQVTRGNEDKYDMQQKNKVHTYEVSKVNEIGMNPVRESRESIINQLHKLVHPTHESHMFDSMKPIPGFEDESQKRIQIPHVPLARSIADSQPAQNDAQILPKSTTVSSQQVESQKAIKQLAKYQYQPKGYTKRVTFEEPQRFMAKSAQSDEVIGYSDFSHLTNQNGLNKNFSNKNYSNIPVFGAKDLHADYTRSSNLVQLSTDKYNSNSIQTKTDNMSILSTNMSKNSISTKYTEINIGLINQKPKQQIPAALKNQSLTRFSQQMPFLGTSTRPNFLQPSKQITSPSFTNNKPQEIFYSPKSILSKPTFAQSFSTNIYKSPVKSNDSVGTLYKQFTDTKVLDILPQQMQNNIRRMRRKYKGVHAKDYFGFNIKY